MGTKGMVGWRRQNKLTIKEVVIELAIAGYPLQYRNQKDPVIRLAAI